MSGVSNESGRRGTVHARFSDQHISKIANMFQAPPGGGVPMFPRPATLPKALKLNLEEEDEGVDARRDPGSERSDDSKHTTPASVPSSAASSSGLSHVTLDRPVISRPRRRAKTIAMANYGYEQYDEVIGRPARQPPDDSKSSRPEGSSSSSSSSSSDVSEAKSVRSQRSHTVGIVKPQPARHESGDDRSDDERHPPEEASFKAMAASMPPPSTPMGPPEVDENGHDVEGFREDVEPIAVPDSYNPSISLDQIAGWAEAIGRKISTVTGNCTAIRRHLQGLQDQLQRQ